MDARCKSCSKAIDFRATRGNRLLDYRCPKCGGTLEALSQQCASTGDGIYNSVYRSGQYQYYQKWDGYFIADPRPLFVYLIQRRFGDNSGPELTGVMDVTRLRQREMVVLRRQLQAESPPMHFVDDSLYAIPLNEKPFVSIHKTT